MDIDFGASERAMEKERKTRQDAARKKRAKDKAAAERAKVEEARMGHHARADAVAYWVATSCPEKFAEEKRKRIYAHHTPASVSRARAERWVRR